MDPEDLVSALVPFLVVLGVIAAIGSGVYYFIALRRGESVHISLRGLFRAYLYLLALISLLITVGGLAQLVNVGFAGALGHDFSYHPRWVDDPPLPSRTLLDAEGRPRELTAAEREEDRRIEEERRTKGLERAYQEGLLDGIIFTGIGAILWGVHAWSRRRLETPDERESGVLNRIYLIVVLLAFGIITISSLPVGVRDALRYAILDSDDGSPPGGRLSTAIVALPFWLVYLAGTVRAIRRQPDPPAS